MYNTTFPSLVGARNKFNSVPTFGNNMSTDDYVSSRTTILNYTLVVGDGSVRGTHRNGVELLIFQAAVRQQ